MKKSNLLRLLWAVLVVMLLPVGNSFGQEAYAVFEDGTLTLKYDDQKPTNAYSIRSSYSNSWANIASNINQVVFDDSFKEYPATSCAYWFYYCTNLAEIVGMKDNLNTASVTDMSDMFSNCSKLQSLDLSGFDTHNVTNMSSMFSYCSKLKTIFVGDKWSIDNVTYSNDMFYGCYKLYGGKGTTISDCQLDVWAQNTTDKTYAKIDGGESAPGYLTKIGENPFECDAYAVLENNTLTFYCNKNSHDNAIEIGEIGIWNINWKYDVYKVVFSESFKNYKPKSCKNWFQSCYNLTQIEGMKENLNTSEVKTLSGMFCGCSKLTSLDLRGFDTKKVTQMDSMFSGCGSLTNLDVSGFDTHNVTRMSRLFEGCGSLTNLDVSGFDTHIVTSMSFMFAECYSLTSLDVSGFDTQNVTDMSGMFYGCSKLTSLDLSGFDTQNVTNMSRMFGYSSLTSLDLSGFDTKNVTSMWEMFYGCSGLTSLDLSGFDTKNVTSMWEMFYGCSGLTSLDLSGFDTKNVTNMSYMFSNCSKLTSLDLSGFDTKNVTSMYYMFCNCCKLQTIYVGDNWTTDNVRSSYGMFINCYNLYGSKGSGYFGYELSDKTYAKIDGGETAPGYLTKSGEEPFVCDAYAYALLENGTLTFYYNKNKPDNALEIGEIGESYTDWKSDVTKVVFNESFINFKPKNCGYWFSGFSNLNEIEGINEYLNTEKVKSMKYMFYNCSKLQNLNLSGFDTKNVTDMSDMFCGCCNLTNLNLSGFVTTSVTDMNDMFSNCRKLKTIFVGDNWTTDNVTKSWGMFNGCYKLYGGNGTTLYDLQSDYYNETVTNKSYAKIDEGESAPGYLTKSGEEPFECDAYAVFENNTLSFFCDKNKPDYALEIGEVCILEKSNITKVVFDKSFKTYKPKKTTWFARCSNLTEIIGMKENLNTSEVKNMSGMFYGCSKLTSLDLSGFDTKNVTEMDSIFEWCSNLKTIYVGDNWSTNNVTYSDYMFSGCDNLIGGKGTTYNSQHTDKQYAIIDGGESAPGYLTKINPISIAIITPPTKTEYLEGEELVLTDGELLVTYDNETTEKVALNKATISGFDNTIIGEQTIKVSFLDLETEFKVTVTAKAIAIAIAIAYYPQLSYTEGEQFSAENGYLRVIYNNSKIDTVALAEAVIDGYNPNKIGEQILTIRYLGLTTDLKVNVNQKQIINPYTEPKLVVNIYYISSFEELFWFMFDVNHGDVKANAALVNDIIINKDCLKRITEMLKATSKAASVFTPWQPIGTTENPYQGTFDGQGHTISGIYIDDNTQSNVGLFGSTAKDAVIKNLGVTDSYIAGNENVGAICGKAEGTVVNCYTVSEVKGNKNVNALVGDKEPEAVVENCYYLTETPIANDPCAKTAEEFKSGAVAQLLSQGAVIDGVTYSGENFANITELPGTDIIQQPENNNNPSTSISSISENNIKVWSFNHTIYIENAPADTKYTIIDINGRVIATSNTKSTREEINTNKSGIMILNIGNQSFKIAQ